MDLAARADRAWEGPESLNGKQTTAKDPFSTIFCSLVAALPSPFCGVTRTPCPRTSWGTISLYGGALQAYGGDGMPQAYFSPSWTQSSLVTCTRAIRVLVGTCVRQLEPHRKMATRARIEAPPKELQGEMLQQVEISKRHRVMG